MLALSALCVSPAAWTAGPAPLSLAMCSMSAGRSRALRCAMDDEPPSDDFDMVLLKCAIPSYTYP